MAQAAALQSALSALQQNNYISVAVLTAVGYDYVLVLPKEIEYIWVKPWTWVSMLFFLVRYCGLYNLAFMSLYGTTFMPGPAKVHTSGKSIDYLLMWTMFVLVDVRTLDCSLIIVLLRYDCHSYSCTILEYIEYWAYLLFLSAADIGMILRVWALYNRSKAILGMLLALIIVEIVSMAVGAVFNSTGNNSQDPTVQILEYSVCTMQNSSESLLLEEVSNSLQMVVAVVLCMLAIFQFVRQSLQIYNVTKQWQFNRYINLLVQQGIIYFFAVFLLNLVSLLTYAKKIPSTGWQFILSCIVGRVPVFTLTPRFIISIREMYAHDIQGGREAGVDTGFGISRASNRGGGASEPIVFAVGLRNGAVENVEADDWGNEERENIELVVV